MCKLLIINFTHKSIKFNKNNYFYTSFVSIIIFIRHCLTLLPLVSLVGLASNEADVLRHAFLNGFLCIIRYLCMRG